jgi:glycosyltransferase involved in cell wall biosynthesis
VVPCYNEAERLDFAQFDEFLETHPHARVIFVDDASTDVTAAVLREYCAEQPLCSMISLERNSGKAEAVRCGMTLACDSGTAMVGYWDADLATPLTCVREFAEDFDTYPQVLAVLGSRVKMLGWDIRRKAIRHYFGRVFATAVSIMLGIPVYDSQCGAKVFRNVPSVANAFERPFLSRWIFDVEILARLMKETGARSVGFETFVRERPLSTWHDIPGSKLRLTSFFGAAVDLLRIWARELRS